MTYWQLALLFWFGGVAYSARAGLELRPTRKQVREGKSEDLSISLFLIDITIAGVLWITSLVFIGMALA